MRVFSPSAPLVGSESTGYDWFDVSKVRSVSGQESQEMKNWSVLTKQSHSSEILIDNPSTIRMLHSRKKASGIHYVAFFRATKEYHFQEKVKCFPKGLNGFRTLQNTIFLIYHLDHLDIEAKQTFILNFSNWCSLKSFYPSSFAEILNAILNVGPHST